MTLRVHLLMAIGWLTIMLCAGLFLMAVFFDNSPCETDTECGCTTL